MRKIKWSEAELNFINMFGKPQINIDHSVYFINEHLRLPWFVRVESEMKQAVEWVCYHCEIPITDQKKHGQDMDIIGVPIPA